MRIGFLFKPDVVICPHPIPISEKQEKPFYDVPEVEWDIQQLPCLGRMYELMVEFLFRKLFASNNHAKEIDSNEAFHEGTSLDSDNPSHMA